MEILARRFGKKIKLPPTVQIKREILLRWLADQTEVEAAEVRKDRFEKQPGVGMLKGGACASNCGVRIAPDRRDRREAVFLFARPFLNVCYWHLAAII